MMNKSSKIYIAGHTGMVGSSIHRHLSSEGYDSILTKRSNELDLRDKLRVEEYFQHNRPEYVFMAAAKVGGIEANKKYPADFIYDNINIAANVIHASYKFNVKKLLFLGSSCIYPKFASQPISEEQLLTGKLEPSNSAYAVAKIAGIEMCKAYRRQYNCNFISCMPCNLYGPNDNYHDTNSHVMAALIKKVHEAKNKKRDIIEVWGSGKPKREFLHVDDFANACIFLMNNYNDEEIINVGSGIDISIQELALLIGEIMGYNINLRFNAAKPDGTPRKLLDISKIKALGWYPLIDLRTGIRSVCNQVEHSV
jgi:GDP-L-fucose synthase